MFCNFEGRVETINRNRLIWVIVAILIIAVSFGGRYLLGKVEAFAEINGEKITKDEFYERLEAEAGQAVFSQMLAEKLILQAAKDAGISVEQSEVDEELNMIKLQFGSEDIFNYALMQNGLTEESLREQITFSLYAFKLSTNDVVIEDAEVKDYFEKNKKNFDEPEKVRIAHILVNDEKTAEEILDQIKKGDKFEDLVKTKSIDTTTKNNNGELGYVAKGQMPKDFEDLVFTTKVNEVASEVIKTDDGYHIIKVLEKVEEKPANYEDSKDLVKEILLRQKAKPINEVLTELKDKATIVISKDEYKDLI